MNYILIAVLALTIVNFALVLHINISLNRRIEFGCFNFHQNLIDSTRFFARDNTCDSLNMYRSKYDLLKNKLKGEEKVLQELFDKRKKIAKKEDKKDINRDIDTQRKVLKSMYDTLKIYKDAMKICSSQINEIDKDIMQDYLDEQRMLNCL